MRRAPIAAEKYMSASTHRSVGPQEADLECGRSGTRDRVGAAGQPGMPKPPPGTQQWTMMLFVVSAIRGRLEVLCHFAVGGGKRVDGQGLAPGDTVLVPQEMRICPQPFSRISASTLAQSPSVVAVEPG